MAGWGVVPVLTATVKKSLANFVNFDYVIDASYGKETLKHGLCSPTPKLPLPLRCSNIR